MSEMKLFEQIEDYLKNRLSPEERQAFEAEMAANPAIAEAVALHRDMMNAVDDQEEELMRRAPNKDELDLRELMENAYEAFKDDNKEDELPDAPSHTGGKGKFYWFAALALLLVAIGGWWMQRSPVVQEAKVPPVKTDTIQPIAQSQNIPDTPAIAPKVPPATNPVINKQDYAAVVRDVYAETPYAPGVLMNDSGDEPVENPLPNAIKAYSKNQFSEVVRLLQTVPEEGRTDALKLRAHAYFRQNRFDPAALDFEALTNSALYKKDAEWYLLLCHAARLPKTETAYNTLLTKVAANGPKYEQRVQELKKRLSLKK